MKQYILGASFLAFAGASTTVEAADLFAAPQLVEAPAYVAQGFSWTGGYFGAHAGYVWADFDYEEPEDALSGRDVSDDTFIAGGYAGYNYQMANNFVVGFEGDFGIADIGIDNDPDATFNTYTAFESNWNAHLRARLGYAFDRLLFFASGGLAVADFKVEDTDPGWSDDSATLTGWSLGGGMEYAVTNNVVLRVEYLYDDYGSVNSTFAEDSGDNYDAETDMKASTVRVGVALKF